MARGKKTSSDYRCHVITTRTHPRCFCDGKLAPHGPCSLKSKLPKGYRRKPKTAGICKPGTVKMYGRNCGCKTKGGGFKTLAKKRCK